MIYLMLAAGLLPIVFVFLVVSLLIALLARKFGRSFWRWGAVSFMFMIALSWSKLPSWSAKVFYNANLVIQNSISKGKMISLAEAQHVKLSCSIDGVNFDVPLTYALRSFNRKDRGWHGIAPGQMDGTQRPAVDFINIWALLPDLEPMKEENLAEFEVLGYGKIVAAALTHYRPWDYYFKYTFPRAEKRTASPDVPGMLHYYYAQSDMYFSHDHATPDLVEIRCPDQNIHHYASPSCHVATSYRPTPDLVASEHIEGAIFHLEYYFSSQYLPQWREIDKKLRTHFDEFIRNTQSSTH